MGLFSLLSRKPVSSGEEDSSAHKFDRGSRGKITPNEMTRIQRRLIDELGHHKAEQVMQGLATNMDSDGAWGGRNVSMKESNKLLDILQKSHYSDMDHHDIEKVKEIFSEYE